MNFLDGQLEKSVEQNYWALVTETA